MPLPWCLEGVEPGESPSNCVLCVCVWGVTVIPTGFTLSMRNMVVWCHRWRPLGHSSILRKESTWMARVWSVSGYMNVYSPDVLDFMMPVRQKKMCVLSEHLCLAAFVWLAMCFLFEHCLSFAGSPLGSHEVLPTLIHSQWKNDLMCS